MLLTSGLFPRLRCRQMPSGCGITYRRRDGLSMPFAPLWGTGSQNADSIQTDHNGMIFLPEVAGALDFRSGPLGRKSMVSGASLRELE